MSSPTDFFSYKKNKMHVEDVPIEKICRAVGTPAYLYSTEAFLTPLRELREGLKKIPHKLCFAMKSNSNIAILQMLSNEGAGVDIVSGGELFRASQAWIPGSRIVFSGVGKTETEMQEALEYQGSGIHSFNVESVEELEVLNAVAKRLNRHANVALRFNPDINAKVHPYISTGLKTGKFGLNKSEILNIVKKRSSFGWIQFSGVSVHIGSQIMTLKPLDEAFKKLKELVSEINEHLIEPLSFVDLGGGLGVRYENEKPPTIRQYCALITKHFGPSKGRVAPLEVILEPGRLLSGNAGALVTKVLYRKNRGSKDILIVDASMSEFMRPALYQGFHEVLPTRKTTTPRKKTDVAGPVCESADYLAKDRLLPRALKRGDHLAVLSAGAYGMTLANNYNSRTRPVEVLVHKKSFRIIRHRETYEDLINGEII